ncbi:MAG: hypothetical protein CVT69_01240 [Actinobacteria bacterium HGW-Actinobacteria-9]|jgi:hypothetical protein|nr:MAG: hypothetical protein CVT69_01240 [Actinobacteria bacterium HGW-Actinobacteria-9]
MLRTRLFRITFSRLLLLLTGVIAVGTILGRSLGLGQGRALAVDAVIRDLFASLPGAFLRK